MERKEKRELIQVKYQKSEKNGKKRRKVMNNRKRC